MSISRLSIALALLLVSTSTGLAHTTSYGFLTVALREGSASGRLELAVRDLDRIHDLDADRDGKITWGEFRGRETEIERLSLAGISIGRRDQGCALAGSAALTDTRGGETYVVFPFEAMCAASSVPAEIGYRLMFSSDAQHRGLVAVRSANGTQTFVMTPAASEVSLDVSHDSGLSRFLAFVGHGAHHIWIGYDHILFLLTLLIGTLAAHGGGRPPGDRILDAVKVVTAFTLAHSLTLGLAAFGVLRIPRALTESLIAMTITLAALNNIWPVVTRRLWLVALGFGLIHGLGFANVLAELDLPRGSLLAALFAFNIGVEAGQLTILFAALPIILLVDRMPPSGRIAIPAANVAIAGVGALWLSDRALGSAIMPF